MASTAQLIDDPQDTNPKLTSTNAHPVLPLPDDDPFSVANTIAEGEDVPAGSDDLEIAIDGAPSDEEFVLVLSEFRHHIKASFLIVKREDTFGRSHFFLTTKVASWAKQQPSLKKFVKVMDVYLYHAHEGGYGLWMVRDSLDNWSVSDRQVVHQSKKIYTRRYTDGKVRKGHSSDAISVAETEFPDKPLMGPDGLMRQAFGEAFVIAEIDHPVLNRLLGK